MGIPVSTHKDLSLANTCEYPLPHGFLTRSSGWSVWKNRHGSGCDIWHPSTCGYGSGSPASALMPSPNPCKEITCKEILITISSCKQCSYVMYLSSGGACSQSSGKFTPGCGQDGQRTTNSPGLVTTTPVGSWPWPPHFKSHKFCHCITMQKRGNIWISEQQPQWFWIEIVGGALAR